jgi:outer membrane scaffolding protein for murein synthesis (MipA/OmpV family)
MEPCADAIASAGMAVFRRDRACEPVRADLPEWRTVVGLASAVQPVYSGARADRVQGGPVINLRYKELAFLSLGEGLGVNVLLGQQYRVGLALGYDRGRRTSDDSSNLKGFANISAAPTVKVFGSWVVSKTFPLVIQADTRQIIGGADGAVGDLEFYLPLPGSSERLVMFVGPSITWANHRYTEKEYGITQAQADGSDRPIFDVHGGTNAVGLGFSATTFLTKHWLLNVDGAISHLRGSAAESPIVETRVQRALALSLAYHWQALP